MVGGTRISMDMNCDNMKRPITNGIAPQIPVQISNNEITLKIDKVLNLAIGLIDKK